MRNGKLNAGGNPLMGGGGSKLLVMWATRLECGLNPTLTTNVLKTVCSGQFFFSTTSQQPNADTPVSVSSQSAESEMTESEQSSAAASSSIAPPGMSLAAVKRVTADSSLEPKKLEQVYIK